MIRYLAAWLRGDLRGFEVVLRRAGDYGVKHWKWKIIDRDTGKEVLASDEDFETRFWARHFARVQLVDHLREQRFKERADG